MHPQNGMRVPLLVPLLITLLLTASCSVGPKYRTPSAPVPPAYKQAVDGWKEAHPQDGTIRGIWWDMFVDPQLNALEEQVDISNQTLAVAEAQFRSARAAIRVARSDLFPTVTPTFTATKFRTSPGGLTTGTRLSSGTFYTLPFDVSYEADLWGRVRNTVQSQIATAQASAADLETARLSIHAELATDYLQLRGLDEQQRLFDATVAAYERALELTMNRYNEGVSSGVDVAQAQTQLETARAQALDIRIARAQFENAIAILIGKPPAELTIPPGSLAVNPPVIPIGLPSELLERRPDIAGSERRVASANAQIGVAKSAFFPTLTIAASGGVESSSIGTLLSLPNRFWSIGPVFAQTLFDAGRRKAMTAETEAVYDSTVGAYRQAVLSALQEVEDNLAALRILSDEATQQDLAIQSAQLSLDLAMNRYRGGITTYLEVITAQNALFANQRTAIDIRTRRMTASVRLVKALGGGWNSSTLPSPSSLISGKP